MDFTRDVEKWHHKHRVVLYDYGRIALGCFLLFKGVEFLLNITALEQILLESKLYSVSSYLAYTIVALHILGGAMMMVGWHTRIACFAQIPIVMCAVLFFSPAHDLFSIYSPFAVALYTLFFLVFYFVGGSGYYSFDHTSLYANGNPFKHFVPDLTTKRIHHNRWSKIAEKQKQLDHEDA